MTFPTSCDTIREAMSARLDGEDPGLPDSSVDAHLLGCSSCRAWEDAAQEQRSALRLQLAPLIPDQTEVILSRAGVDRRAAELRPWRPALVGVAFLQLIVVLPPYVSGADGASAGAHLLHELRSWNLALAVGWLFVAARPARAWGMLPFAVALISALVLTTVLDLATGRAVVAAETTHLFNVVGAALLWVLARRTRRPLTDETRKLFVA